MKKSTDCYIEAVSLEKVCLSVQSLKTVEDKQIYRHYLDQLPDNPFYKEELLQKKPHQNLYYFVLEKGDMILGLMPFILRKIIIDEIDTGYFDVTSPYGYCGPLLQNNLDEDSIAEFWSHVDQWYRNNKVITEFVRFNMERNWVGYNGELVPTLSNVCGNVLAEDEQWANFKPKVRNNYRKALKNELECKVYYSDIPMSVITDFHRIYEDTMKRRKAGGQYFHSLRYFGDFIANNPRNAALAMVYYQGRAISTELLLLADKRVYSFLGGTYAEYFKSRPNDMLKIGVLNWARNNGFKQYFLGGGRIEDDNLYKYKKRFFPSDEDLVFYTGRKVLNEKIYKELYEVNPFCVDCPVTFFFPKYRCNEIC